MIIGANNFLSLRSAERYYARQGLDHEAVKNKLEALEISIGPPIVPSGWKLAVIADDGRYAFDSGET